MPTSIMKQPPRCIRLMEQTEQNNLFLALVRLGVEANNCTLLPEGIDWDVMKALAVQHGLLGVIVDGIEHITEKQRLPKDLLFEWIGLLMQEEARYAVQLKAAIEMSRLFHDNGIRTYVLKGNVVAECYPKPEHRVSSDLDCYLMPDKGNFDAWELGNDLINYEGIEVATDFYKNSSFLFPGLIVENHRYMVPFRGNKALKMVEIMLRGMLREDKGEDRFDNTWLYRPPVMVTSLFLIEHAYSHFLHEGLTWRHVMDWMLYSRKHNDEINWTVLETFVDEFGFRRFYDSYNRLGKFGLGELKEVDLTKNDKRMLEDVWAPLDLHETLHGIKGKLGLVGNTLRAWWKYHYFAEISMIHALWIQVYGFLFDKNPTLD